MIIASNKRTSAYLSGVASLLELGDNTLDKDKKSINIDKMNQEITRNSFELVGKSIKLSIKQYAK